MQAVASDINDQEMEAAVDLILNVAIFFFSSYLLLLFI